MPDTQIKGRNNILTVLAIEIMMVQSMTAN